MTAKNIDVHAEGENSWRTTALGDLATKLVDQYGKRRSRWPRAGPASVRHPEFLNCCGSTALIEACEVAEMKPLKTASAMRKALEGKAPRVDPTKFGAPGPKAKPAGDPVDEFDDGDGDGPLFTTQVTSSPNREPKPTDGRRNLQGR